MRTFFHRHSFVYRASLSWWLTTITLATVVGIVLTTTVQAVQSEKRRFGSPVTVFVTTKDLAPGSLLSTEDYREDSRPRAFVEASPLAKPKTGTVVKQFLPKNAVLTEANLGSKGASPLIQLLHEGERGLLLPSDSTFAAYRVGDVVDLFGVAGSTAPADRSPEAGTRVSTLALGVRVVDVAAERIVVAVPRDRVEALVAATALGSVTPVFSPEASPTQTVAQSER